MAAAVEERAHTLFAAALQLQHTATHCNTLQYLSRTNEHEDAMAAAVREIILFIGKPMGRSIMISNLAAAAVQARAHTLSQQLRPTATLYNRLQYLARTHTTARGYSRKLVDGGGKHARCQCTAQSLSRSCSRSFYYICTY